MTALQVLRIMRLCQRWGITPAQAAALAALVYGEARE
jgi:hypothetical protein